MKTFNSLGFIIVTTVSLLTVAILFSNNSYAAGDNEMPPAQVSVVAVEERLLAPSFKVSGSVISLSDANISTQVSGELLWLAEVGSEVQAGDVIAEIESTLLSINLESNKAKLSKMQVELAYREQEVKRFNTLGQRDNTSKARMQEEVSKRNMLKQDVREAKSMVEMATFYLAQSKIRAPFSGHVMARIATKGEYLSNGDQVIRLVDTFNREISVNASIDLLPLLSTDLKVLVANNNKSKSMPIKAIVPVGDNVSRLVEIRLSVSDNDWIVGLPVTVNLPSAPAQTRVSIPRDALIIKGSAVYIYRINNDMKSEKIDAEIDAIDGLWLSIKHPLSVGDKIVVRGGERLMPGQSVSFTK